MIQNLLQKILAKLFGFDKVIADIDARVEALPKDIDVRLERIEQTQLRFQIETGASLQKIIEAVIPLPTASVSADVDVEGAITEGALEVKISDTQGFNITLRPKDAKEQPSQIDPSKSKFTTDHPELLQLTPGEDGVSCKGIAIAGAGSTQVQYSVTDLNDPSDVQSDTLDVEIVAGKTASIQADFTVFDQQSAPQAAAQ